MTLHKFTIEFCFGDELAKILDLLTKELELERNHEMSLSPWTRQRILESFGYGFIAEARKRGMELSFTGQSVTGTFGLTATFQCAFLR